MIGEGVDDGVHIELKAIRGELHPIGEAACQVLNKISRTYHVALAYKPCADRISSGVQRFFAGSGSPGLYFGASRWLKSRGRGLGLVEYDNPGGPVKPVEIQTEPLPPHR